MRCILYARFSTDRQSESSIEDQLRVCQEYIRGRGWSVAGEFSDHGISGAALGNRPGVQAALTLLTSGDALVITDLSRLSRSQDLAPLLSRLRFRGVRVLGVQDGYDTEARTARMQAGLSGIMSEEFRMMVADRTRSALEQRARDGRPTGGKAFDNADLVREIFTRFAAGESMRAIASDLNGRGIPSPGAQWKERSRPRGAWQVSTLHTLLQNELYAGRQIWNRSRWVKDPDTGKRQRIERPRSEWVVREIEPIVDEVTWQRVQARFVKHPGHNNRGSYILSGLLVCGLCGGKLIVVGGSQRRYVCGTHHAAGPHACANRKGIPRLTAETRILARTRAELLSAEAEAAGLREMRAARAELEREAQRPGEVDRDVRELERLVREGILSPEAAAPSLDAARRRAAQRRSKPVEGLPWPTAAAWREAVNDLSELLMSEDPAAARAALREIIGEVRCYPAEDHVVAELAAVRVVLATGTGISIGSGGPLRIDIPTSTRPAGAGDRNNNAATEANHGSEGADVPTD